MLAEPSKVYQKGQKYFQSLPASLESETSLLQEFVIPFVSEIDMARFETHNKEITPKIVLW